MPAGNQTGHDTDYCVGHPPPGNQALLYIGAAFVGTVVMLAACGAGSKLGVLAGFILAAASLFAAAMAVRKLGAASPRPIETDVARRALSLGTSDLLASAACPTPSLGVRYHLGPNSSSPCPETWPVGETVVFLDRASDVTLASIVVTQAKCTLTLKPSLGLNAHGQPLMIEVS